MFIPNTFLNARARSSAAIIALTLGVLACEPANPPVNSIEVAARSVQAGALSDSGQVAVIGSLYHGGSLWRLEDGERLFNWNHAQKQQSSIVAMDFSADGRWALTADTASTLVLWNTQTGEAERYWVAPGPLLTVSLDAGAERALLGLETGEAVLFDIRRGGILHRLKHDARVNSVALSSNGEFALTGSDGGKATTWDLNTGDALAQLNHEDDVQLVALSPDNTLALSVSKYDRALVWHPQNGKVTGEIPLEAEQLKRGLRFTAARFSDDSRLLLTGRPDGIIELWEVPSLRRVQHWQLPKRNAWLPTGAAVIDVAFSADGRIRAIASNGFIHTFDMKKPAPTE